MHQMTSEAPVLAMPQVLSAGQLALVTGARLAIVTSYRVLYPLLPLLAQRFGTSLQVTSLLVTVLVLAGLISPLGGVLADTRGERTLMLWGLSLFCVGVLCCALAQSFAVFMLGYVLIGLAIAIYQPSAQAYLSNRTPYHRRGWALGVFEVSWAAAALVGVAPLMQLVGATNETSLAYWPILVVGLLSLAMVRWGLPASRRQADTRHETGDTRPNIQSPYQSAIANRRQFASILAMLSVFWLTACAVDQIFVVQSAWLGARFAATPAQLGQVFALMGIAELLGSLGSTFLVDRVGKKRAVVVGFAAMALCAALLPLSDAGLGGVAGGNWLLFLPLLFLFDMWFEFAIVSSFPLASGVAPALRGTVLALSVAANGLGRGVGSLTAEPIWRTLGIGANAALTTALLVLAVVLCAWLVREEEVGDKVTQ